MSRAFVREDDAAPEPPIRQRTISGAPNWVTRRGARLIRETIAQLKEELTRTVNPDAAAAHRRDLRYWHAREATMQLVSPDSASPVSFGARITMSRGSPPSEVTIVGEDEADPTTGRIAWTAPLARALDGAEVGDVVEFEAGGRRESITVTAIADSDDNDRSQRTADSRRRT